ncbi:hypothetical protein QOM21_34640 [Streptomyces sp. Pv4-95]
MGGDHNGVCTGECTGYKALSHSEWVKKTEVSRRVENGDIDVKVFPTDAGFDDAENYDTLWERSFSSVPVPKGLTEEQRLPAQATRLPRPPRLQRRRRNHRPVVGP